MENIENEIKEEEKAISYLTQRLHDYSSGNAYTTSDAENYQAMIIMVKGLDAHYTKYYSLKDKKNGKVLSMYGVLGRRFDVIRKVAEEVYSTNNHDLINYVDNMYASDPLITELTSKPKAKAM